MDLWTTLCIKKKARVTNPGLPKQTIFRSTKNLIKSTNNLLTMKKALALFFLMSCTEFVDDYSYRIQPELKPFVDSFFEEAAARGILIEKSNLDVYLLEGLSKSKNAWGQSRNYGGQRIVVIDKEWAEFYLKSHPNRIEPIMFHELGHAILRRGHNNLAGSLMNPGRCSSGACYEHQPEMRKVFIDELFEIR